jgi:Contractile injection system tape measure protein
VHVEATSRDVLARELARATLARTPAREPPAEVAPAAAPQRAAPRRPRDDADRSPSLLVPAAGLVLLHPFMPRLFAACGVIRDERCDTIDDTQRPRAAALLHWLAHGDAHGEPLELELPFIKVLLGLTPDDALAPQGLRDSDRVEAQALLVSVIAHWSALRNTGVDALRVTFLQRRGLLEARDGAWHLRLQTEAFDMLVASLPWGIGYLRLPWMTAPLITDWPTP